MTGTLTARRIVPKIRRRIEDTSGDSFADADILDAVDEALQPLFTMIRTAGRDHELDRLTITLADATALGNYEWEYALPEQVAAVVSVTENTGSDPRLRRGSVPSIPAVLRGRVGGGPIRFYSRRNALILSGRSLERAENVDIWYVRRWPPMHFGLCQAGGVATTFRFGVAANVTGTVKNRAGLYEGIDIEIDNNNPAGALDQINRIKTYTGGAVRESTMYQTWTVTPDATSTYSLVIPLAPEHGSLLIEEASAILLRERGDMAQLAATAPERARLTQQLKHGLANRDQQAPPSLWNSDG